MEAVFFLVDVYHFTGSGFMLVGKVMEGTLKPGMKMNIDGEIIEIKSMKEHHKEIDRAPKGTYLGIYLGHCSYNLRNAVRQKLFFSDNGSVRTKIIEKPKKKGFFDSLLGK